MVIDGEFKDVRFEISLSDDDTYVTQFEVPSDHLCQCTRRLIVSSVLGKPLRTLHLDAVAFALGPGYEDFPDYVHRLVDGEKQTAAPVVDAEAVSEPNPRAGRL